MKKTLKMVLCLALAVLMLSSVAFASQADGKPEVAGTGVTLAADNTLTVNVAAADVTEDAQYVILVVKANGVTDAMTTAQAILDGAKASTPTVTYDVGENTIYYIDQSAATASGLTFTGKPKEGLADSLIILGGGTDPVVVGAIKTFGIPVTGTVTLKGAADTDTMATLVSGDMTKNIPLTGGTASFSVLAPADATKITAKGTAGKYVDREYDITAEAMTLEVCPKGDVAGNKDGSADGKVNISDYSAVLVHAKGNKPDKLLTGYALKCADVAGNKDGSADGKVNISDYSAILVHAKGNKPDKKLW